MQIKGYLNRLVHRLEPGRIRCTKTLLVMKLTVFFLTAFFVQATASSYSQQITFSGKDVSLETIFSVVEKQTGYVVFYNYSAIKDSRKITINARGIPLKDFLDKCIENQPLTYSIENKTVLVTKAKPSSFPSLTEKTSDTTRPNAPPIDVRGRVVDAKGEPVPGATVVVKGSKKGTKTDGEGNFMLENIEVNSTLIISSIGFETKEVFITGKTVIVKMNEIIGRLDETVIIGYGTTTQRFNTGNVTSIKAEDIAKQPVTDPLLALQGRVPGMIITQTTGVVGGQVKVQIRGQNSLSKGVQPLFIIDGVPYNPTIDPAYPPLSGSYGAAGNILSALSFINPTDIESIDILKDADATAIYGSRGANGVILINTKKGGGINKLNVNVYNGWGNVTRKISFLDTKQYLQMRKEAFLNDGVTPTLNRAPDLLLWDTTKYTDWQEELVGKTANYTNVQASTSGGNGNVRYLIGGNYHKETTVFPGSFSNRKIGTHFSITGKSTNQKFTSSLTGSFNSDQTDLPQLNLISNIALPPNAPSVYNEDGTLNWAPNPNTGSSTWANPYLSLVSDIVDSKTYNLLGNIEASYRFTHNLLVSTNVGFNKINNGTFRGTTLAGVDPKFRETEYASGGFANSETVSWIFEPRVNYSLGGEIGKLDVMVGGTFLGNISNAQFLQVYGIKDDGLIRNLAAGSSYFANNRTVKYKYAAVFGRLGYSYKDKYLMNLTLRRDGSSRFGPSKQFATFWALGMGWIFSQEQFMQSFMPVMSYGKIRFSYGLTGNDQIGDYQYLDRYDFNNFSYQGIKGLKVVDVFNADFAWEVTRKMEVGLENGFLKDRILFNNSFFINRSTNQLIGFPLPAMTGAAFITGNLPAVIQNSGWEMVVTSKNLLRKSFEWSTSFNISLTRNKLVSYSGNGNIYAKEGRALSEIDLYKILGVNPKDGAYVFDNGTGEGVPYDMASQIISINPAPVYYGGIQNVLKYKGFSLDVFFQYVKQYGSNGLFTPNKVPGSRWNQSSIVWDRWQKDGDNSRIARFSQNGRLTSVQPFNMMLSSNRGYTDASFIRCKNLTVSWEMPSKFKRKIGVDNWRIYLQGQNLFTITKYPGWDPETQTLSSLPPLRIVAIGTQILL